MEATGEVPPLFWRLLILVHWIGEGVDDVTANQVPAGVPARAKSTRWLLRDRSPAESSSHADAEQATVRSTVRGAQQDVPPSARLPSIWPPGQGCAHHEYAGKRRHGPARKGNQHLQSVLGDWAWAAVAAAGSAPAGRGVANFDGVGQPLDARGTLVAGNTSQEHAHRASSHQVARHGDRARLQRFAVADAAQECAGRGAGFTRFFPETW